MTNEATDVVVVGARAAGAATAMLLARAGLSVLVVDQDREGADTLSTHALLRGGVLQLHRWGVLPKLVAAGTPPIRETTFRYSDSEVAIAIKPADGVAALYAPRRTLLDPVLVDAARRAGAEVRFGQRLVGLTRQGDGVSGVVIRDRRDGHRVVAARLVVGADGRRSTLARLVSAPVSHRAAHTSSFVYGYFRDLPADGYEWAYRPEGMAGFIPTNGGMTCVFAGHLPSVIGRGGVEVLHSVVAAASPGMGERLRAARLASPVRTFTGQPGLLRRPWGPGWALVGDAGSWKDPISAHGLTDALRDAELLATAAAADLAAGRPDPGPYRSYEQTRNHLSVPILRGSDEIAAMRWDDARIRELLIDLNLAMNAEVATIRSFTQPAMRSAEGPEPYLEPSYWTRDDGPAGLQAASPVPAKRFR